MRYKSKTFSHNNYFILYDLNDEIVCYFDNFIEISKYINYRLSDLVHEFNRNKSNIITIIIDREKYKLATFC